MKLQFQLNLYPVPNKSVSDLGYGGLKKKCSGRSLCIPAHRYAGECVWFTALTPPSVKKKKKMFNISYHQAIFVPWKMVSYEA